jgi:hypothetical protein
MRISRDSMLRRTMGGAFLPPLDGRMAVLDISSAVVRDDEAMPKLILDEAANQLAAARLVDRPIYGGPDGSLLRPGVIDLLDDGGGRWAPANAKASYLVLADDACREIVLDAERFVASPELRKRIAKRMTVSVCSLMDVVAKLRDENSRPEAQEFRTTWPRVDQATYRDVVRSFKRRLGGPVRKIRNKLGAHLDEEAIRGIRLEFDDLLGAIGDSIVLLLFGARYPASEFTWIRSIGRSADGTKLVVETMFESPFCVRWITDAEGHVVDVEGMYLAEDPREELRDRLLETANAYNKMASTVGSAVPRIWCRNTNELRAEEAAADAAR